MPCNATLLSGTRATAAAAALIAFAAGPAWAQMSLEELATYSGADREQLILEGAQAEGELSIYTSQRVEDMEAVSADFEERYGIDVTVWRANSDEVLQRAVAEYQAERADVDVFETNGNELEAMHREGLLQPVTSSATADILPSAVRDHGEWVGTRLNIITAAFNTDLVDAASVPATWTDFLDPQWAGKIGVEEDDADWFAEVVKSFPSEEEGLQFFRDLVAGNGVSVRKGHALMLELVAAGEIPLAMTVYQYQADDLKSEGAPVDWFAVEPAIGRVNGVAVAREAPHPYAALLFYDYLLTTGQELYAERNYTPTNLSVKPLPEGLDLTLVDPVQMLDDRAKWQGLFEDIILSQATAE